MNAKVNKVFISGKFRVIHAGHLRLFRTANEIGNNLVVALDVAGLNHEEIDWRLKILSNIDHISKVLTFESDVSDVLRTTKPDVVLKGQEFRDAANPELEIIKEYGGKLVFSSGANFFSESDMISDTDEELLTKIISLPQDFISRNGLSTRQLISTISSFSNLNVCVIGDLIVDEYINCHPLGMSQEEPTIVVTPIDKKRFFGGAGIVAAHCQSLGAKTTFITATGDDEIANWAIETAKTYKLTIKNTVDKTRPTTLKQRFRSGSQTLLKVSQLTQDFLASNHEDQVVNTFEEISDTLDVLIFSDFSYGLLTPNVVERIMRIAGEKKILIAADSQSSSQIGSLDKFEGANLISATEREARLELKNSTSGLVVIAENLRAVLNSQNLLLKLGPDGVLISASDSTGKTLATDEISSLNKNPIDTSGAGDSMLAASTLALATGADIYEAALIGSILSAIQVGRIGNTPISQDVVNVLLAL
jgi:rfaE bifunctional protein kinase chain/domain